MRSDRPDIVNDLIGGCGPLDRHTITVPVHHERLDVLDEKFHRTMRTTPDHLPRNDTVPDLDLVHPGSTRGCEMKNNTALLLVQPARGLGRGVHRGIVKHDM